MGSSKSKNAEISDSGTVNNSFLVQENGAMPMDARIALWVIAAAVLLMLFFKVRQSCRRGVKKDYSKSVLMLHRIAADIPPV